MELYGTLKFDLLKHKFDVLAFLTTQVLSETLTTVHKTFYKVAIMKKIFNYKLIKYKCKG